ncbi:NAD(P)-dependent dehydrogenase (short-subunit alcohol dehydrogenase family) [Nakamurella sp. UYEF19]|uniref:SDR family NAD(P)-dependent oxidoreductase n=1 Tax=Nakamurella sp. UYEF19 TaxID=1756392 RepID=UPI00339685D2
MSCVLVTGGSRGIGAGISRALAARGDRIAVHCRSNVAAAEALVAELPGEGHVVVAADLADEHAVAEMVHAAVEALGTIDILVNNAGIYLDQPIQQTGYEEWNAGWREVLGVNLLGAAAVTWQVVDHLRRRERGPAGGRIVMVGSRGAYRGEPTAPSYGASKAGLHALTQSLAVSLGPEGIVVNGVAPGFVATDMTEQLLAGPAGDGLRAQSPFGRVGEVADIAAAVAWLSSPEAQWTSGAILDANGASYLR